MLLGCLLGAFLPAFANDSETIGGKKSQTIFFQAWGTIALVFFAVIFAGIPTEDYKKDWAFYTSVGLLGTATLGLAYLMIWVPMWSKIGLWRAYLAHNLVTSHSPK